MTQASADAPASRLRVRAPRQHRLGWQVAPSGD